MSVVVPAALTVDWESGEGRLQLSEELAKAPARFRADVLADWKDELERLLAAAEAALEPRKQEQEIARQRQRNQQRRRLCEELAGQTVELAEPLVNGDVMLHLANGSALVLYAYDEDVKLETVDPVRARLHAQKGCAGDTYVREDPPQPPQRAAEPAAPVLAS
ncbi:hypothetical protein [Caldimonas brevitalea]|uniref:Uncharacterized protein n=1 Tax=Caldimonas brevitalea TaxID=413882 RepID=A0A0G3BF77_9BURK|nr:hypothetical protein [Caldimonas brevitalea]AKJ28094.1 hypothetical protein AAW51_1403 [Caldimonas brevitalea]